MTIFWFGLSNNGYVFLSLHIWFEPDIQFCFVRNEGVENDKEYDQDGVGDSFLSNVS